MRRRLIETWTAVIAFGALALPTQAEDAFLWDQSGMIFSSGMGMTWCVAANDFVLPANGRIDFVDMWLGTTSNFSGTISWAILEDDSGSPGQMIEFGTESSPERVDPAAWLARLRIRFPSPIELSAGVFWLALHENAWLSPDDSSNVAWAHAPDVVGEPAHYAPDPTEPTYWDEATADSAFVLYGLLEGASVEGIVFASGFESGMTCAWLTTEFGPTCTN